MILDDLPLFWQDLFIREMKLTREDVFSENQHLSENSKTVLQQLKAKSAGSSQNYDQKRSVDEVKEFADNAKS